MPNCRAFTLIELLVVVSIIVVLLALLTPALDKALASAEKAVCLAHQRAIVQGCQQYALGNRKLLPPWKLPNVGSADNYDWRSTNDANADATGVPQATMTRVPLALGLLPAQGYLPEAQLNKLAHCPTFDNTSATGYVGIGMDRVHVAGVGASYWLDPAYTNQRIIGSYSYRSASYQQMRSALTLTNAKSSLLILIDMPDARFGNTPYGHNDGFNRIFGDGSGTFYLDPNQYILTKIMEDPELAPGNGAIDGRYKPARCEYWLNELGRNGAPQ